MENAGVAGELARRWARKRAGCTNVDDAVQELLALAAH